MPDFGLSKDSLRNLVNLAGEFVGTTDTQILTNKEYNTTDNSLTATSQAAGDLLKNNGTKFVRLARGTAGQPLKVNSGGTDLDYGTLPVAGGGTGATTLTGILKGSGTSAITAVAAPTGALLGDSDVQNISGGKTFLDQTFKRRNPANTFTLTQRNPIITADADTYLNSPYSYHIFKVGSTYFAENGATKAIAFSGATLDPVLTSVLSALTQASGALQFSVPGGGYVYVDGGVHNLSGSFAGWDVPSLCTVELAPNCLIYVAGGYTGYVFKVNGLPSSTSSGMKQWIKGGYISEAATRSRLWTGVLFAADSQYGIFDATVSNITFDNCGRAIHLRVDTALGWANGHVFENIMVNNPSIAVVEFDYNGQTPSASNGFHRNYFQSIEGQAGAQSTYGYKNIHGILNTFTDCKIWDIAPFNPSGVSANITANASYTRIRGGIMTSLNFSDLGVNTLYDDDQLGYVHTGAASNASIETIGPTRLTGLGLQTPIISPSTAALNSDISLKQYNNTSFNVGFIPFSDAQTNTMSWWNTSLSERMYIQRTGGSAYIFDSVKQLTGGTLRPIVFRMNDAFASSIVESFRIQTDASIKFSTFHEHVVVTAPSNPAAGLTRSYSKQIDSNNDGRFYKAKINGAVVEVQY